MSPGPIACEPTPTAPVAVVCWMTLVPAFSAEAMVEAAGASIVRSTGSTSQRPPSPARMTASPMIIRWPEVSTRSAARGTAGKDAGARGDGGHVRQACRGCRHADEDVPARIPGGVQDGRAAHCDLAPGQGDVAASVALRRADTAVDPDLALGGGQPDLAAGLADAGGLNCSRAVAGQDVDVAPGGLERCGRGVDPARDGDVAAPARACRDIEPADALARRDDNRVRGGQARNA